MIACLSILWLTDSLSLKMLWKISALCLFCLVISSLYLISVLCLISAFCLLSVIWFLPCVQATSNRIDMATKRVRFDGFTYNAEILQDITEVDNSFVKASIVLYCIVSLVNRCYYIAISSNCCPFTGVSHNIASIVLLYCIATRVNILTSLALLPVDEF